LRLAMFVELIEQLHVIVAPDELAELVEQLEHGERLLGRPVAGTENGMVRSERLEGIVMVRHRQCSGRLRWRVMGRCRLVIWLRLDATIGLTRWPAAPGCAATGRRCEG
jgi:hypothetical protein